MKTKLYETVDSVENLMKALEKTRAAQKEFAKLIGISPQAISKWEREQGYPDISLLPVLANLLCCSVNDFFEVE